MEQDNRNMYSIVYIYFTFYKALPIAYQDPLRYNLKMASCKPKHVVAMFCIYMHFM